jgi:hypothetical protein
MCPAVRKDTFRWIARGKMHVCADARFRREPRQSAQLQQCGRLQRLERSGTRGKFARGPGAFDDMQEAHPGPDPRSPAHGSVEGSTGRLGKISGHDEGERLAWSRGFHDSPFIHAVIMRILKTPNPL